MSIDAVTLGNASFAHFMLIVFISIQSTLDSKQIHIQIEELQMNRQKCWKALLKRCKILTKRSVD